MLMGSERNSNAEKTPIFLDVLMEGLAVNRSELTQESESQREQQLSDLMSKKLRVPLDLGRLYTVKDSQHIRYAFHIPDAGIILHKGKSSCAGSPAERHPSAFIFTVCRVHLGCNRRATQGKVKSARGRPAP